MKGSENSGQRKKQTAEFSEGKGQRKAAKKRTAKSSEIQRKKGQQNSAKFSEKKGQRKAAEFSEKKQAAEFLKIPTRTTIICVVPHLRPTHRCRLGCRAHLTAGKSVEIMRTDYTVLSVYCGKRSYMNEHEPIKNQM